MYVYLYYTPIGTLCERHVFTYNVFFFCFEASQDNFDFLEVYRRNVNGITYKHTNTPLFPLSIQSTFCLFSTSISISFGLFAPFHTNTHSMYATEKCRGKNTIALIQCWRAFSASVLTISITPHR